MSKKIILSFILLGSAFFNFIGIPVSWIHAAEETDAYCAAPKEAVPHGSTVALTIKFSDSDKSNDIIVQGPFKILKYVNGKAVIVEFKRGNDKDDKGKEDPEKPTLSFNVTLSPKHALPAPATESVIFTYFVKHKEGRRGKLATIDREQQVDCFFTVQHDKEEPTSPSGGREEDNTQKNMGAADLGIDNVGILPTSRFYFLKEWRRGISRFFTFNSVNKMELELGIANQIAAEALRVQETMPDDAGALATALENYTKAGERLRRRLDMLKEASENPNVEKLLEKLNDQTLKHALLLNQLAERWNSDPYVEDANVVNPQAAWDNHLQGAVDIMQRKIQEIVVSAAKKEKNIEQKAREEIERADIAIHELKSELEKFLSRQDSAQNEKTGPIRLDPTPARLSMNTTIESQTPKRDFGDRMKAGLDEAGRVLTDAKVLFEEGKFGEAFGKARSVEVLVKNYLRVLSGVLRTNVGEREDGIKNAIPRSGVDADSPRIEDKNSAIPDTIDTGKKIIPETEKRVFPETNNRTVCDDKQEPACLRGEILECRDGRWACIGQATGGEQIINPVFNPAESPSINNAESSPARNTPQPATENSTGYTFAIMGFVYDVTDAPAMTSGKPMAGVVLRSSGPKIVTIQTRSDGSYTLAFTEAPMGTYDVCITPPSGYKASLPTGCETVTVRLSEKYDKTIELINNGNAALHETFIHFNMLRQ